MASDFPTIRKFRLISEARIAKAYSGSDHDGRKKHGSMGSRDPS
jgi:hypothetical protein